jgi:hypothetical protein
MKKSEFLAMVQEELDTIKTKATKEEIGKLELSKFSHRSRYECIYGLMTGICKSDRAKEIFGKTFDNIPKWIDYQPFSKQSLKKGNNFTPLEKYLYMVDEYQHIKIIQYLKNIIETISL